MDTVEVVRDKFKPSEKLLWNAYVLFVSLMILSAIASEIYLICQYDEGKQDKGI